MVSKEKYYELKTKGLCTKCGKDRAGSPSDVRCLECHDRFLESKKEKREERVNSGVCIQCGKTELLGNSKYCNECREKNSQYKKNLTEKPIVSYRESNEHCRSCNGQIDTLGVVCQKCLDQVQFSKADALTRYGSKCASCFTEEVERLCFASSDITVAMKHSGPELYRYICFSSGLPKEYLILCHECYWKNNIEYIKRLRNIFLEDVPTESGDIVVDAVSIDPDTEDDSDIFVEGDENDSDME